MWGWLGGARGSARSLFSLEKRWRSQACVCRCASLSLPSHARVYVEKHLLQCTSTMDYASSTSDEVGLYSNSTRGWRYELDRWPAPVSQRWVWAQNYIFAGGFNTALRLHVMRADNSCSFFPSCARWVCFLSCVLSVYLRAFSCFSCVVRSVCARTVNTVSCCSCALSACHRVGVRCRVLTCLACV